MHANDTITHKVRWFGYASIHKRKAWDYIYSLMPLPLFRRPVAILVLSHCYLRPVDRDSLADKTKENLLLRKCKEHKQETSVFGPFTGHYQPVVAKCPSSVWGWVRVILFYCLVAQAKSFHHLDTIDRPTDHLDVCAAPPVDRERWRRTKFERRKAAECEWPIFGLCTLDWNFDLNCFRMENESWENWNWPEKKSNDNFNGRTHVEFDSLPCTADTQIRAK